VSAAGVDLAEKQVEQAQAELDVTQENLELAANAEDHRDEYADVSYEMTALEAATRSPTPTTAPPRARTSRCRAATPTR
jgi:hypothetical protein